MQKCHLFQLCELWKNSKRAFHKLDKIDNIGIRGFTANKVPYSFCRKNDVRVFVIQRHLFIQTFKLHKALFGRN